MAAPAQEETHAIIKFCVDLGKTPTETIKMMKDANRSSNVSRSLVFKWHKRFSEGRESLKDDTGRGRKRIVNAGTVAAVKSLIEEDRRLTVSDISTKVGNSYGRVHSILRNQLKMSKVHARWVPRLLKNAEKERRVQDSLSFLRQYERHGDAFLDRIITTDETWLWFYDPESIPLCGREIHPHPHRRPGSAGPEESTCLSCLWTDGVCCCAIPCLRTRR